MPQFAANLTMLFTELPFMERFAAARAAGFDAVEYLFPYAYAKEDLMAALKANGLKQVLHNLPAGNWDAGDRGMACDPARVAEFTEGVGLAIAYARALDCPRVNCLAGKLPAGVTFVDNGDGTGTLAGTPVARGKHPASGTYKVKITATFAVVGLTKVIKQTLVLTVS